MINQSNASRVGRRRRRRRRRTDEDGRRACARTAAETGRPCCCCCCCCCCSSTQNKYHRDHSSIQQSGRSNTNTRRADVTKYGRHGSARPEIDERSQCIHSTTCYMRTNKHRVVSENYGLGCSIQSEDNIYVYDRRRRGTGIGTERTSVRRSADANSRYRDTNKRTLEAEEVMPAVDTYACVCVEGEEGDADTKVSLCEC